MADSPLDVKQLVDSSGKTYKVEELAQKGFKEIQVLEKNAFNALLQEAVDRVLSLRGAVLNHEERQKIMEETKMELRLLAQENDMIKHKSERDRDSLLRETENLHQQLMMHRKLSQEQERVRFDEGVRSLQPVVDQLRLRVEELETELTVQRAKPTGPSQEQLAAQIAAQAASQAATQAAAQAAAQQAAQQEAASHAAAQMASQMAAQMTAMQAMLDQRLKAVEESTQRKESELAAKKDDGKANADLEKMMMRLGDTLGRKISSMKNGEEDTSEYRPGEATMQGMLSTEGMESNLSTVTAKKEISKGAGLGALAKLKAMQSGLPVAPPETPTP